MTLDISSAESSYSHGRVQWEKFIRDFNRQWGRPLEETMLAMFFEGIEPGVQAQLGPQFEAYRSAFDQAYGRGGGNGSNPIQRIA